MDSVHRPGGMYLLIDDMKNYGYGADIIARTAEAGKAILEKFSGQIDCLGIDYDLGGVISGYDIIRWAFEQGYLPDRVEVVSLNPPGRRAIVDFLKFDADYKPVNNSLYVKE